MKNETTIKMDYLNIYVKNIKTRVKGKFGITREALEDALGPITLPDTEELGIMIKLEPVFKKEEKKREN